MKVRREFIATLVVAGLAAAAGYSLIQPQWRTATEAEVRAALNPALVVTEPANPGAQKRMDLLEAALKRFKTVDYNSPHTVQESRKLMAGARKNLEELKSILAEGPLQRRPTVAGEPNFPNFVAQKYVMKTIALWAPIVARDGKQAEAVDLLELGVHLTDRLHAAEMSLISVLVDLALDAIIDDGIRRTLPLLGEPELKRLASHLPPAPMGEVNIHRALRTEFQDYLMPLLPDPIAWSRRVSPEEDPDKSFAKLFGTEEEGNEFIVGGYDALDSVDVVNHIAPVTLENTLRPRSLQDKSADAYVSKIEAALPLNQAPGNSGVKFWLRKQQYRWEMARTPNSFGRSLVLLSTSVSAETMTASFDRRAGREGTRTLIALRRYHLRNRSSAPDLQSLVSAGLLPALSFDHCGTGPLRYDPKRNLLWSVSRNGVDDGGTSGAGSFAKPDTVWSTL